MKKRKPILVYLPEDLIARLDRIAKREMMSRNMVITLMLMKKGGKR